MGLPFTNSHLVVPHPVLYSAPRSLPLVWPLAPRTCRVTCSPKGPKLGFEYLPTYKTLHCMHGIPQIKIRYHINTVPTPTVAYKGVAYTGRGEVGCGSWRNWRPSPSCDSHRSYTTLGCQCPSSLKHNNTASTHPSCHHGPRTHGCHISCGGVSTKHAIHVIPLCILQDEVQHLNGPMLCPGHRGRTPFTKAAMPSQLSFSQANTTPIGWMEPHYLHPQLQQNATKNRPSFTVPLF